MKNTIRRIQALLITGIMQQRRKYLVLKVTCLLAVLFLITRNLPELLIILNPSPLLRRFRSDAVIQDPSSRFGLILDTPGCMISKLDPYDKSLETLIQHKKPYVCRGDPVFLITLPNSTVLLDQKVLKTAYKVNPENVSCTYQAIVLDDKHTREDFIKFAVSRQLAFGKPLGEEFLKIHCKLGKKKFNQYLPLVPIKPNVERKATEAVPNGEDALNVILIGIDSVSKLNFLRHFKKTHSFLSKNMSAFDMKGYTKVGDNTFPNLTPLLTGHFVEHYWNESLRKTMYFDKLDFIWKTYAARGYRTFYAEDSPYFGTFNYLKKGFQHPPTDYYFRPLDIAIHESDLWKKGSGYCLNNQLETEIIYRYLKDFVKTMKDRSHFAFAMVSSLTHDYLNYAGYCDEPTYNLLEDLWKSGAMNRSLVVVFSDHGIRFGKIRETYIGKIEERMPFMYLSLPKWYLDKHQTVSKNLKTNTNRLVTLFDVHATLYHLLNVTATIPEGLKSNVTPNGLSLLGEISEYRTCESAKILPHWCTCQVYQYVPPNDRTVVRVASEIVDAINKQLEPFQDICARLEVDAVTDARIGKANDMVVRFVRHQNTVLDRYVVYGDKVNVLADFLVTLKSRPGDGMFEGTVRHDVTRDNYTVIGISRINMYGTKSWCIDVHSLKKFCFCK